MIKQLDEALRKLIEREVATAGYAEAKVRFEAPTKDWAARNGNGGPPSLNVFLYDIREDLRRREANAIDARPKTAPPGPSAAAPRWYKLSYLITAWTVRAEDEHDLLSIVLSGLLQRDSLEPATLSDSLPVQLREGGHPYVVPYTIGLPPPEDRALSDLWSALGGELKPSLDLVLTVPFDLRRDRQPAPAVRESGVELLDAATGLIERRVRGSEPRAASRRRVLVPGPSEERVVGEEPERGRHLQLGQL